MANEDINRELSTTATTEADIKQSSNLVLISEPWILFYRSDRYASLGRLIYLQQPTTSMV
jgi:hypothetical protein